jgi:hypothetical protein
MKFRQQAIFLATGNVSNSRGLKHFVHLHFIHHYIHFKFAVLLLVLINTAAAK